MTTNRYANGKIYKLVNNVDDKIYVGSTCGSLKLRKSGHKAKSLLCNDRLVYKHIADIGGWDNVQIVLIEECPCENKMELLRRERHWIDDLKPELNKALPTRTPAQYYEDNKDQIKERVNAYRIENEETVKQRKKTYYENNIDKMRERKKKYMENNKNYIKQSGKEYYQANKEQILEKVKQYRERNKEKIAEKKKEWAEKNKDKLREQRRLYKLKKKQEQQYSTAKEEQEELPSPQHSSLDP
jgi:hypothetical protein